MAALHGLDGAQVLDLAFEPGAFEAQPATHPVGIADVERRGGKARDIDHRAPADGDARGIDEEHAAVGEQLAEDDRRVLAHHPVEHRARGVLLQEAGDLVLLNRELLPVDDRAGRVRDGERLAVQGDRGAAERDAGAARIGLRGAAPGGKRRGDGERKQPPLQGVPSAPSRFTRRHRPDSHPGFQTRRAACAARLSLENRLPAPRPFGPGKRHASPLEYPLRGTVPRRSVLYEPFRRRVKRMDALLCDGTHVIRASALFLNRFLVPQGACCAKI